MTCTNVYEYTTDMLDPKEQNKMHLCRNVRNYLVHEPEDFIYPTQEMIDFLDMHTKKVEMMTGHVKDVMVSVTPLTDKDTVLDAARKLSRYKCIPYVNDDGVLVGLVTDTTIRKSIINCDIDSSVKEIEKYLEKGKKFIKASAPAKSLSTTCPIQIVTDTGKRDGKYKGIVFVDAEKE